MSSRLTRPIVGLPMWMVWSILTAGLVGIFCAQWRRAATSSPIEEVHRSQLELRENRWYVVGQNVPYTGLVLETYEAGTLKSRSTISNGLLEGLSEGWYTNGQRQVAEQFRAGVSHGRRTKWHRDGRLLSEADIVNGQVHGLFRRWHEDGSLAEEMTLQNGQPDGASRAFYPSGFVKAEARFRLGKVLVQRFWNDGEVRPTPNSASF